MKNTFKSTGWKVKKDQSECTTEFEDFSIKVFTMYKIFKIL